MAEDSVAGDGLDDLDWLPGGRPAPGRVARVKLRSLAEHRRLETAYPAEALLPALTTYEAIKAAATVDPAKPAIVHVNAPDGGGPARAISYAELIDQVTRAANLFVAASAGDAVSVATLLPMIPEALIASWGAAAAGLSTALNPYLEMNYVISAMRAANTTVLVTAAGDFGSGAWDKVDEILAAVPSIRRVFIVGADDPKSDFQAALTGSANELQFTPVSNPDADVMYQLTGGTTAAPKLARLTHRGTLVNAWLNGIIRGMQVDGAVGHAMPNFHIGGAVVVALKTILFSQTLVTLTSEGFRNPDVITHFWDIARRHGLTACLATPTTVSAILAVPGADPSGHRIAAFSCGGSTVPLALTQAFHDRFGIWLRENWGLSEAQGTVTAHPLGGPPPLTGSVGVCFPYFELKAIEVDADNRFLRECATGERGVLAVKGPIIPGYVDPTLNDGYFIKDMPDGGRWGNSGDLGSIDEDGFVWIFGRAKDLIIRGGHNIDPKLIEEVLLAHPAVQLAAAVGWPDPEKGELPIAYVQLADGATATPDELRQLCRTNCQERASVPREIVVVQTMPTTPVGKISKPDLRRDALKRCVERVAGEVVGTQGTFSVAIDEAERRPRVIIALSVGSVRFEQVCAELQDAFSRYEFQTTVKAD